MSFLYSKKLKVCRIRQPTENQHLVFKKQVRTPGSVSDSQ